MIWVAAFQHFSLSDIEAWRVIAWALIMLVLLALVLRLELLQVLRGLGAFLSFPFFYGAILLHGVRGWWRKRRKSS